MTSKNIIPSAYYFDLDGTLLDTAPDLAAAVNYARDVLLSMPPLPIEHLRSAVTKGTYALTAIGVNLNDDDPMFASFRETMLGYYLEHVADLTMPFPGVEELLDYLDDKQLPWGVVTNKPAAFAQPLLRASKLNERSKCLVCGDSTNQPKPHPAHLLLAAELTGNQPNQCAYIGDASTDMRASRRAGMYAIAAAWGYIEPDEDITSWQSDIVLHSPKELLAWIKGL